MPFFFILDEIKNNRTDKTANTATSLFIFQSSFVVYMGPVVAVASCFCIIKNCLWLMLKLTASTVDCYPSSLDEGNFSTEISEILLRLQGRTFQSVSGEVQLATLYSEGLRQPAC